MTDEQKQELKRKQIEQGYKHANNLIPLASRPPEEQLEIRRKAQKAQTEAKRRKKELKQVCEDILSLSASALVSGTASQELAQRLEAVGIDATIYDVIVAKQTENALNGSTKSAEFVRDSAGDKPTDKLEMQADIITESDRALLASISDRLDSLEAVDTMSNSDIERKE